MSRHKAKRQTTGTIWESASFYKTVTQSPQWKAWEFENADRHLKWRLHRREADDELVFFDMAETMECGVISPEHFQEFLKFCTSTANNRKEVIVMAEQKKVKKKKKGGKKEQY